MTPRALSPQRRGSREAWEAVGVDRRGCPPAMHRCRACCFGGAANRAPTQTAAAGPKSAVAPPGRSTHLLSRFSVSGAPPCRMVGGDGGRARHALGVRLRARPPRRSRGRSPPPRAADTASRGVGSGSGAGRAFEGAGRQVPGGRPLPWGSTGPSFSYKRVPGRELCFIDNLLGTRRHRTPLLHPHSVTIAALTHS